MHAGSVVVEVITLIIIIIITPHPAIIHTID